MEIKYVNTEKALSDFFKKVIRESKNNLKAGGHRASGDLIRKMDYSFKENPNSIEASLLFPTQFGWKKGNPTYGEFLNFGVKGTESGKSLKGYRYRDKKPPVRFLRTWLKQKSGRFRRRNQDQIAYAIQNTIYKRGIRPTEFFSKPFEKEFKKLPDEVVEAYGLDVEQFMEFVLND